MPKTYNTFTNVSTGDVLTATNFNNVLTNIAGYRVPPMCRLTRTTAQTIATGGTAKTVEFGTSSFDTDSMGTTGASAKIVTPTAGVYQVSFFANWDNPGADITRQAWVERSSTRILYAQETVTNGALTLCNSMLIDCAANDELTLKVYHERGSNLDITTFAGSEAAMLSVVWVGQKT